MTSTPAHPPIAPAAAAAAPTVTILMAAHNARRYIEATIRSLLTQTFDDFEFLVMDDGSTDGTSELLDDLARADARLIVHHRPRGNFVALLNEGIGLARGQFVARADADDLHEPTRLAEQVAFLEAQPHVVAVGSRMLEIDPYDVPLAETDHEADHETIVRRLLDGDGWAVAQPAITIRTDVLRDVGGYRPEWRLVEDLELFLRLAEVGELANLTSPLVRYRRHLASVNATNAKRQRELIYDVCREARARRGLAMPEKLPYDGAYPWTIEQLLERWAWAALRAHRADVARRHAWQLVRRQPTGRTSWKVLACALRGH